jgi:DNA-binding NtrC family response regulator
MPAEIECATIDAARQGERILIVDDDESVRRYAALILQSAGYEVLEAENGEDAVRACASPGASIRLVLADVVMPKLGGRQLASEIASLHCDVKVILMSGYPNLTGLLDGIASRSEKVRAECQFLRKPFKPGELIDAVRMTLQNVPTAIPT